MMITFLLHHTEQLGGAYAAAFQLHQQFVGVEHFMSITRVIGRTNLPLLISECVENLSLKVRSLIPPAFMPNQGLKPCD